MVNEIGKWIIFLGFTIALLGIIVYFFGDKLRFIGNLPGDIRFERDNFRFYFPITTMILFGVVLNILVRVLDRKSVV